MYRGETCTDQCGRNWSDEATSTAADYDLYRVEACRDPCGLNWSNEAGSAVADYDLYRAETCRDLCDPNLSDVARSTAADDDLNIKNLSDFDSFKNSYEFFVKFITANYIWTLIFFLKYQISCVWNAMW